MQKIIFLALTGSIFMLHSTQLNAGCCLIKDTSMDNKLTVAEKKEGWKLLFDGKTISG